MADFDLAIGATLLHEDPTLSGAVTADSGGVTRWGISRRAYPAIDISELSLEVAIGIYWHDYWLRLNLDEIADQPLAGKIFDLAVNMGPSAATRLLQGALRDCGAPDLLVDGALGPATIAAANAARGLAALAALRQRAADRYRAIAAHDPSLSKYLDGWLERAAA